MNIAFENVSKRFGDRAVFDGLNAEIKSGKVTCITGRSGCGKTTFLRMLMGLETPDTGRITGIEGKRIACVFQEDRLCEALSASANAAIALRKSAKRGDSDGILRELGLGNDLLKPVSAMSGGMKRRVAIARALAAEYDILLLDEPFTGLDTASRDLALACILRHAAGKTVLLVTHDPEIPGMTSGEILDLAFVAVPQM